MTLLLLAGTAEARDLATALAARGQPAIASLAGATREPQPMPLPTVSGGFGGAAGLAAFLDARGITAVLDATHPFAAAITARSAAICAARGLPYLRLHRPGWQAGPADRWTRIAAEAEAAAHIPPGATVFLATGRQHLDRFAALARGRTLIARVIDPPAAPFPFPDGRFLPGRPPFTLASETALFRRLGIGWLVSREFRRPRQPPQDRRRRRPRPAGPAHRPPGAPAGRRHRRNRRRRGRLGRPPRRRPNRQRGAMTPRHDPVGRRLRSRACVAEGAAALAIIDPRLAPAIARCGPLNLRRRADGFAALLSAIVSQQVSVAAARAIWGRMRAAGLTAPRAILAASDDDLRACGLSRQKIRYARALAAARLPYGRLRTAPTEEVTATLVEVPGIGIWTAEIYAMFSLGRANVFAPGDLALQEGARMVLGLPERPKERALREIAEAWAPWRAVAARLLWAYYGLEKNREGTL